MLLSSKTLQPGSCCQCCQRGCCFSGLLDGRPYIPLPISKSLYPATWIQLPVALAGFIYLFLINAEALLFLSAPEIRQGVRRGTLGAMTSNHNLVLSPASRFLAALLRAHAKQMMKAGSYGHISWCIPWLREKATLKQAVHWPVQSILSIHLFPVLSLPKFSALGSNGRGSFLVFAECLAQ